MMDQIKDTGDVAPSPMPAPADAPEMSLEDLLDQVEAHIFADGGMDQAEMQLVGSFFARISQRAQGGPMGAAEQAQTPMPGGPVENGPSEDMYPDERQGAEAIDFAR